GEALSNEAADEWMQHLLDPMTGRVSRWYLPGTHRQYFLLGNAWDGGRVPRLRLVPQGMALARQLLVFPVPMPTTLAQTLSDGSGHVADASSMYRCCFWWKTLRGFHPTNTTRTIKTMSYDSVFKPGLFADQTIMVTGGGSGIGRCTAHELAALGAHVV